MNNNVPAMCSICCEEKIPVAMCSRCNQADKRVCEQCAVRLYDGCSNAHCNCFGFKCPYCRAVVKTSREWTQSSAVYWEAYAAMLATKLEDLALQLPYEYTNGSVELEHLEQQNAQPVVQHYHNFS